MIRNYNNDASVQELNKILIQLTELLDITPTQHKDAVTKYEAIANYLTSDEKIKLLEPDMYPQGSFSLGTVTKPLSDNEEYDIDLVCELNRGNSHSLSQSDLKSLIGNRLKEGRYRDMLKDQDGGRRCWTIEYAEDTQLHLDILPAIPDTDSRLIFEDGGGDYGNTAISITDNEHPDFYAICDDWVKSNPRGYQKWFKDQMELMFNESRKAYAELIKANIDDVPDYEVKTPLQRAIQLLKRHRDTTCKDDDDKPISIIITTLAAKAYGNESNLYDALMSILDKMEKYIKYEMKDGKRVAVIENPVDTRENFADKWEEYPNREKVFYAWLQVAKLYFKELLGKKEDLQWLNESLGKGFGENIVKRTFVQIGKSSQASRQSGSLRMSVGTGILGTTLTPDSSRKVRDHKFHGNGK